MAKKAHQHHGRCQRREELSLQQQAQLRHSRDMTEKKWGNIREVENITIQAEDGTKLNCIGEFKYLGTLVGNRGGASLEIRRRIGLASSAFSCLWRIWESNKLPLNLKLRLYSSLVEAILLHNAECWAVNDTDVKVLESFYFRFLRRLTRTARAVEPLMRDHASHDAVYSSARVPCISRLLRERRLRWIGHLIRSPVHDGARVCLFEESQSNSRWWRLAKQDIESLILTLPPGHSPWNGDLSSIQLLRLAQDRAAWRRASRARNGLGDGDA